MLDENRSFLPREAVDAHVCMLNRCDTKVLATEWEVFILNRLHKIGTVHYEKKLGGSSRPDVLFDSDSISGFLADIRTVSDKSYEKENPVDYFYDQVKAYLAKKGPGAFGINVRVDHELVGQYGDQKVKLHLPPKGRIPAFVKEHFKCVAERIRSRRQEPFSMTVGEGKNQVRVAYDPNNRSFTGGHFSPSSVFSLRHNPVYNSLKRKSEKLRDCQYEGVRGVFLCDGGCDVLRPHSFHSGGQPAAKKIIDKAFRDNPTLSFVVLMSVEEERHHFDWRVSRALRMDFLSNPQGKCVVGHRFWAGMQRAFEDVPRPQATPTNALDHAMTAKHKGLSFSGSGSMSNGQVKIPSRMLTEILAGTLNYFEASKSEDGPLKSIGWMKRYFHAQLQAGKTIAEISVERCPDEDDDWITIRYGPSDPAISMFE